MGAPPDSMSSEQLITEWTSNAEELRKLQASIKDWGKWDTAVAVSSAGLASLGIGLAVPTGGWSLLLSVASATVLGLDVANRARHIPKNARLKSEIEVLERRNQELRVDWERRLRIERT